MKEEPRNSSVLLSSSASVCAPKCFTGRRRIHGSFDAHENRMKTPFLSHNAPY